MSNMAAGRATNPVGSRQDRLSANLTRTTPFPLLYLLTCFLPIGCANPGPPKSPSLHLPAFVSDLAAKRVGNRVHLQWTTPSRTTDDLSVKGAMTAQICREVGPRPGTPAARLVACAPVLRVGVAPGASEISDTLPAAFTADPALLLTYRIRIFNAVEHSAGDSEHAAFAASGAAPLPLEEFNGRPSEHGAVLEWAPSPKTGGGEVELTRTDLSVPRGAPKPAKPSKPHAGGGGKSDSSEKSASETTNLIHLRAPETIDNHSAGTVDANASFGHTYTYTGERVRSVSIGSHALDIYSATSSLVTVVMRDTFPPRSPAGLATVPGTGKAAHGAAAHYIDLSWEPNTESDLAGYFVYRQLARPNGELQGLPSLLTPSLVTNPVYRDVAVSPGQRYIYQVTAVDASGNESAPSAKAQEAVPPE